MDSADKFVPPFGHAAPSGDFTHERFAASVEPAGAQEPVEAFQPRGLLEQIRLRAPQLE